MKIRLTRIEDTPAIARVRLDTWKVSYRGLIPDAFLDGISYEENEKRWRQALWEENKGAHGFIAEDDAGVIMGMAIAGPVRDSQEAIYKGEIYTLYVLPAYQRQGAGRALLDACVNDLREQSLMPFLLWAYREGPGALGGRIIHEKEVDRGGKRLIEVCFVWN